MKNRNYVCDYELNELAFFGPITREDFPVIEGHRDEDDMFGFESFWDPRDELLELPEEELEAELSALYWEAARADAADAQIYA